MRKRIGKTIAFVALGFMAYVLLARCWEYRHAGVLTQSACATCPQAELCEDVEKGIERNGR